MKLEGLVGIWVLACIILSILVGYFYPNYYNSPKGSRLSSRGIFNMIPIYLTAALISYLINYFLA